ncbi:MAG TPA: cache domain-containing protein [Patescibacteria group bacterium]|nr:cache domain-containing protein [Patescibacteria group bacterium]
MNQFWLEYLYFVVSIFAILVGISAASLFVITMRAEKKLKTIWRALGFSLIALSFLLFILERKYSIIGIAALITEVFAFFSIYKGVSSEPDLTPLQLAPDYMAYTPTGTIPAGPVINNNPAASVMANTLIEANQSKKQKKERIVSITAIVLIIALSVLIYIFLRQYIHSALAAGVAVFIAATIPIQVRRLRTQSKDRATRAQNIYPLIGYIMLLISGIFYIFYRLPDLNIVFLRQAKLEYSAVWQIAVFFSALGFLFLFIWAWNFIKLRVFLRTYVVILTVAIIISTLGSLVFTSLIFTIVEKNNLQLMIQGSQAQQVILVDRSNAALFIARTISNDSGTKSLIISDNKTDLSTKMRDFLDQSGVDFIKIYNQDAVVIASPQDERDVNQTATNDSLLQNAISEKKQAKSFDVEPGVLSDVIVARGIVPIISNNNLIGMVEVGYKFDNAYVDFAKEKTTLDVTIYTGSKRSATTIKTLDGVSRWTGSEETDQNVVKTVLQNGEEYSLTADRLGIIYYNAYEPIRNTNGQIIGMVSVGVPTNILFENTRQQLISTFLIMTLVSILIAMIGYYPLRSFQKKS